MTPREIIGELVVGDAVTGPVLRLEEPLSLWGGFDTATGEVVAPRHPQRGCSLTGKVVLMRAGCGSSSSSSVLLESVLQGTAPAALVLEVCDPILAIGAAAAAELYGKSPTVARVPRIPGLSDGTPALVRGPAPNECLDHS